MKTEKDIGSVAALWRFPVKSMAGEALDAADLTERGVLGDRAWAIIDLETGKVVSAKNVRDFPHMLACRPTFVEPPRTGHELPPVRIALPDGKVVTSDSPHVDRRLSAFFGRAVRLARPAPAGHPDAIRAEAAAAAFLRKVGIDSPVAVDGFVDLYPVSVITTSTLRKLDALAPGSRFDARRFRMNVVVETAEAGFPENGWVGREIALGATARIRAALPDPRCALTTLAQDELPHDPEILRTLVRDNSLELGAGGLLPCAGVYAEIGAAGAVRTGDRVTAA